MTSDFEGFSIPYFIHYIFFSILILQKEPVFPFECWVLNKGTTGTIFITSLVWRGPWRGLNPGPPALEASTLPLGYRGGGETLWFALTLCLHNYSLRLNEFLHLLIDVLILSLLTIRLNEWALFSNSVKQQLIFFIYSKHV